MWNAVALLSVISDRLNLTLAPSLAFEAAVEVQIELEGRSNIQIKEALYEIHSFEQFEHGLKGRSNVKTKEALYEIPTFERIPR